MSNNIERKEYYLRTAGIIRIFRSIIFVLLIIFILGSITFFRDEITVENMRFLMKYIDVQAPGISDSQRQIRLSADKSSKFSTLRGNVAVISGKNFGLYDFSGRRLFSSELKYASPAVRTGKKYILTYDVRGKDLSIFNSFSCVFSEKYEYGIKDADILQNGAFAVVTSEKNYRSGIIVYNKDFKEILRWMSRDKYVTSISLSPDEKTVLCTTTFVNDGEFISEALVFDIKTGEQIYTLPLDEELPFDVSYNKDGFIIITDNSLRFYDFNMTFLNQISFGQKTLDSCYLEDNFFAAAYKTSVIGSTMQLCFYDYQGNLLKEEDNINKLLDVSSDSKRIYVLEQGLLHIYEYQIKSDDFNLISFVDLEVSGDFIRVFSADRSEYILVSAKGAGKYSLIGS